MTIDVSQMTEIQRDAAIHALYDDAIEISKDDPSILTCDFESFCNAMWTEDLDRKERGLSREDYRYALQSAWEKVHVDHL